MSGERVVLDLGDNGPTFLSSNLRDAAKGHEDKGWPVTGRALRELAEQAENPRPLVVIDPEDREAVERLIVAFDYFAEPTAVHHIDRMQAALREFADPKPPKPEEPMGLGAVVEDVKGNRWIAHEPDGGMGDNAFRWLGAGSVVGKMRRQYADIDAVKVLSEGVR